MSSKETHPTHEAKGLKHFCSNCYGELVFGTMDAGEYHRWGYCEQCELWHCCIADPGLDTVPDDLIIKESAK